MSEYPKCPLDEYFEEGDPRIREIVDWQGRRGKIIGWSHPIKLTCPIGKMKTVGGWHLVVNERGEESGIHPKMVTDYDSEGKWKEWIERRRNGRNTPKVR